MSFRKSWICVTIEIAVLGVFATEGSELNCFCWDEIETNGTLKSEVQNFENPPTTEQYQYIGVKSVTAKTFKPCICDDVLRMTSELKLQNQEIFDSLEEKSGEAALLETLQENITSSFKNLLDTQTDKIIATDVTFLDIQESSTSRWTLEVVLKGRSTASDELVAMIKNGTQDGDGNYTLDGVGSVDVELLSFTVLKCSGEPPPGPKNGKREWDSMALYPGDSAIYTCNDGYVSGNEKPLISECKHEDITWSIPDVKIKCEKGCQGKPPDWPWYTLLAWNKTRRREGDTAKYNCMDGYTKNDDSIDGISTCSNGKWTEINPKFKCHQILCPIDIPQVPAYGKVDWDGETVYTSTRIMYTCIKGYWPSTPGGVPIKCLDTGKWQPLPYNFQCIHEDDVLEGGIFIQANPLYTDYDNTLQPTDDWFWSVTIPAIIAMVIASWCCMCCTRIDSPLFFLCRGNTNNKEYVAPI